MRVEYAELTLKGGRETNQDRISVAVAEDAALMIACDGMGGHAEGERAAVVWQTQRCVQKPVIDAADFAHEGAEWAGEFAPGKTRHACDHGESIVYKADEV